MEESLAAFLRSLESKNRSAATIKAYRTDILQFLIWLKENNLAAESPQHVERADIIEFLASLSHRNMSGISRARKLASLREFFRYLMLNGTLDKAPTDGVDTPRKEKRRPTYFRPEEYNRLLSEAGGNTRDYAIIQVFLQTGVRLAELCALTVDDIDLTNRLLHVREGKGMKARSIELEKKAITAIKSYLSVRPEASNKRLFLNRYGEAIGERGVRKIVTKYRIAAGITKRRAGPHALRHTFATQKAEKGISPYRLKEWLGHTNLNTTQLYVHLAQQNAHKVMDQTSL